MKIRIVSFICTISIFVSVLSGCSRKITSSNSKPITNLNTSNWNNSESGVVVSNGNLTLSMNSNSHFTIKNNVTGEIFYSSAYNKIENAVSEQKADSMSELVLTYYDPEGQKCIMTSKENSIDFGAYTIKTKGNSICVDYTFSLEDTVEFVPSVLSEEIFKKISSGADTNDKFKLKLLYKYYRSTDNTTEANEIHNKYPYSKGNNLYVLKNSISDSDKKIITRCVNASSYSQENYYSDLENLNITLDASDIPISFKVPVIYALENDGFTATIDINNISSANNEYTLQSLDLLPYFNNKIITDKDGFIFVPDGSGAQINISKADNFAYSQNVFGNDLSCKNERTSVISKNALMPVFGMSNSNGSYFAIINGAAPAAKIQATRAGTTNYCAHGFSSFNLKAIDGYAMRKSKNELSVFSTEYICDNPCVKYVILPPNTNYIQMANVYKDYLKSNQILNNNCDARFNLYLDFTGYVTTDASFMGFPYQKKIVLSTVSEIISAVKKLENSGINNIYVRLNGYSNGGKYHYLNDNFSIDKNIGTVKELKELDKLLKFNGGALILENDITEIYKDSIFDNFRATNDAVKMLDKTLANISVCDMVTSKETGDENVCYLLSPTKYKSLSESFLKTFNKKLGNSNIGISSAKIGNYVLSDFRSSTKTDRISTVSLISDAMSLYKENGIFATDVGNSYSWKFANHLLNIPLSNSNFSCEETSIPFLEMVLHGKISYCGESFNNSNNSDILPIKSLLNGANPHFDIVTSKNGLRKISPSQTVLPSSFDDVYEDIIEFYQNYSSFYESTCNQEIIGFNVIKDGVYKIDYKNGITSLFNTTKNDFKHGNINVSANSFSLSEVLR